MIRQGKYTRRVTKARQAKRASRRGWRWFRNLSKPKKFLVIAGPILVFLILTPVLTYLYYANDIADQERLMNRNNTGVVLTDRNGETIYSVGRAAHREVVPLGEMSKSVKDAVIAAEDKDFYKHEGFSVGGILRSLFNNVATQSITGGGSTLTQQLAKNTLLSENQTFLRKYQELFIALAIEQRYTKDQILEMYLNSVFYGENAFGIEDAAKTYFGKSPKDLDLAESAMLIGVLPAPSAYSPISGNPEYAKERQTTVLTRMVANGYITEAEKVAALAQQLAYAPQDTSNNSEAPHFAEMVMQELYDKYGEETVTRSGYQVQTTLDLNLQRQLKQNIASRMNFIQANGGTNASGVAVDPTNGEVRALVGSADWNNPEWGKVNMVTSPRQPGSSFKPVYYAAALADGVITPATILHDIPTNFNGQYVPAPQNADRRFRGDVTARSAISQSLNIPSIEVMQDYEIDKSVKAARQLGIQLDESKQYGLSLALGTAEAPLIQMTNAYAAFANQGQQYNPTVVKAIKNKFNASIFAANEKPRTAISADGAFLISSILSDTNARAPIFGSSLTVPGRTAAVKTGTTEDARDAWTIGYTPQLAVGVWVGNNNNAVMRNGGSGMAGPIWVNTMKQALAGVQNTPFTPPSGVIQKPVCYDGGLASASGTNTYNEYFLASALPTKTCNAQQKQEEPVKKPEEEEPTPTPAQNEGNGTGTGDEDPNEGENEPDPNNPGNGGNGTGNGSGTGGGTTPPGGGITVP